MSRLFRRTLQTSARDCDNTHKCAETCGDVRNKKKNKNKKKKDTRSQYARKKGKKGHKSSRGVPEDYDQVKKPVSFGITPKSHQGIKEQSEELGLSMSEFIEQIGRGKLKLSKDED